MAVDQIALTEERKPKGSISLKPLFYWDKRARFPESTLRSTDIEHGNNTSVLPKNRITPHLTGSIDWNVVQMKGNKETQTASSNKVPSIIPIWASIP